MNNKEFINNLNGKTGKSERELNKLVDALAIIIGDALSTGKEVQLPGMGTFSAGLVDEKIERDSESGRKIMVPPHIHVDFKGAASLLHNIVAD